MINEKLNSELIILSDCARPNVSCSLMGFLFIEYNIPLMLKRKANCNETIGTTNGVVSNLSVPLAYPIPRPKKHESKLTFLK